MFRRLRRVGILVWLPVVAALTCAAPAGAAGPVFSITPTSSQPYFVFNSSAGAVIQDQVRVVNVSSVAGRARVYPVDATTGQTSGAVYESPGAPRRQVGSWISVSQSTVSLGPHQGALVPFTVLVPSGAPAGEHLGGLVAAPLTPTSSSTSQHGTHTFHVNVEEIAVVAVQVNLPGPVVHKLEITGVRPSGRPGYQTLLLTLANTGNSLLKGKGNIQVTRAGQRVLNQDFPLDTMVPATNIDYPVYVRGRRLAPGDYEATVVVHYTAGGIARGVFPFSISTQQVRQTYGTTTPAGLGGGPGQSPSSVPIWAIGIGALLLVVLSVGGSSLYFRRRAATRQG